MVIDAVTFMTLGYLLADTLSSLVCSSDEMRVYFRKVYYFYMHAYIWIEYQMGIYGGILKILKKEK